MSLLGPSLHRLATPATCDHCVYKPSAPVPTVPLYFWMLSLGERGVLAHSLVGSAVSVACRVPVRSRHKLLGDRASLFCLYLWGLSRSHGCEAVCALGLMPGAYVHCCCPCPPASPKTKLVVSDLCISLPRETNFAEAHKLPGHKYCLDSFIEQGRTCSN